MVVQLTSFCKKLGVPIFGAQNPSGFFLERLSTRVIIAPHGWGQKSDPVEGGGRGGEIGREHRPVETDSFRYWLEAANGRDEGTAVRHANQAALRIAVQ